MSPDRSQSTSRLNGLESDRYSRRRQFLAIGAGVGTAFLAGCSGETDPSDADDSAADGESDADGVQFRLLVSDMPADIEDFDRLDVSFDSARIFDGGDEGSDDESNDSGDEGSGGSAGGNDDQPEDAAEEDDDAENPDGSPESDPAERSGDVERQRGFYVLDLEDATVDLTAVVGDRAMSVFEGELSSGTYEKIELHVSDVEGIVDGDRAEVDVPSDKLQITSPFELRADDPVDFVFDINVVERGQENGYNLTPVISESGVAGEDVDVDEVDGQEEEADSEGGTADAGDDSSDENASDGTSDDEGGEDGAAGGGDSANETTDGDGNGSD